MSLSGSEKGSSPISEDITAESHLERRRDGLSELKNLSKESKDVLCAALRETRMAHDKVDAQIMTEFYQCFVANNYIVMISLGMIGI